MKTEKQEEFLLFCWQNKIFDSATVKSINKIIYYLVNKHKERASNSLLFDEDDLVNESMIKAWKAIEDYKMICKKCNKGFKSKEAFEKHCLEEGIEPKPRVAITSYIYYRIHVHLHKIISNEKQNMKMISISNNNNEENGFSYLHALGFEDKNTTRVDIIDLIEKAIEIFSDQERKIIELILAIGSFNKKHIAELLQFDYKTSISYIRRKIDKTIFKFEKRICLLSYNLAA